MVGLDRADARQDPRVDAVAPAGRDVETQVRRRDLGARQLGGAVAAGEQRPQPEDRAEGAHHDQEEHTEQQRQRGECGRRQAAAGNGRGSEGGGGRHRSAPDSGDRPACAPARELERHGVAARAVTDERDELGAHAADAV